MGPICASTTNGRQWSAPDNSQPFTDPGQHCRKPGITKRNALTIRRDGGETLQGLAYIARLTSTGGTTFNQYARGAGTEYLQPLNPCYKTIQMDDGVQNIGRVVDAKLPKSLF